MYAEELPPDLLEAPFYQSSEAFSAADYTYPIYAGLEYKTNAQGAWEKPELSHDLAYQNILANGTASHYETRPILLPAPGQALYVHRQTKSVTYYYSTYGINWFSRMAASDNPAQSIETQLTPSNPLKAPVNVQTLLIREEKPQLLLTSEEEQERLARITNGDKTLVRLTFNYHHQQELITRQVPVGSSLSNEKLLDSKALYPDDQEIFADKVEIFYRDKPPQNIQGQVISVEDHPVNPLLSIVKVGDYTIASTSEVLSPVITSGHESHYIGSTLVLDKQQHIVQAITIEAGKPVFTLHKNAVQQGVTTNTPATNPDQAKALEMIGDGVFMVVENMQNAANWGTSGELPLKVEIGDVSWGVHREVIGTVEADGSISREVEKTRGIWTENATIVPEPELVEQLDAQGQVELDANGEVVTTTEHRGLYKITFQGLKLPKHSQQEDAQVSVEWFQGVVRVFTQGSLTADLPNKTRKVLEVVKIDNVDTNNDLVVYVQDASFSSEVGYDSIQTGSGISVNFYPGYKVYLYTESSHQLTEAHTLPDPGEDIRYSIFGLYSKKLNTPQYVSAISIPSLMFAQEIIEPKIPEKPLGALYATRPDFFGRATYTFTTQYQHRPHGLLFYRASESLLLHALYEPATVQAIKADLKALGGNQETYVSNRWQNFLNFNELTNDPSQDYQEFEGYRFPNPDNKEMFEWANGILTNVGLPTFSDAERGTIKVGDPRLIRFVEGAIYSVFVPLTRLPITYQYIKGTPAYFPDYEPVDKPQVMRDRNGHLLSTTDDAFDMAPMMKIVGTSPHQTQFTDFSLDGTSDNLYFYGVRETNAQMKMGAFSDFLGPVKLVNTNPPEAPEVKSIMPRLEDVVLDIPPAIELEVNAYPEVQNIKKLNVYRAFSMLEARSVRTMQLVESIDLKDNAIVDQSTWKIADTFADLTEIPYGEGLFYRVTAAREVAYAHRGDEQNVVTEYAPSKASRILASMMVEVKSPATPNLTYTAGTPDSQGVMPQVVLHWDKTCYKGKYHVYKMNARGNWVKIYELANEANSTSLEVPLQATDQNTDRLPLLNNDNELIYHHFKVVAENTAGMLSTEEKILTVYFQGELPQYALALNGTSDYLESQPGFVQWGKSQPFTMQFFVKDLVNTGGSGFFLNPLFCSLPNGSGGGLHLAYNNQEFMVSLQANSSKFNSRYFLIPPFDLQLSLVTHIALVYNGNGLTDGFSLYLNGLSAPVKQDNNKLGALEIPQTTSFTLGRGYSWTGGTNYAQAKLRNFSVVDYAKTEAEITQDMNNGEQAAGSGAYLLAYDFNLSSGNQTGTIPGLSGSPGLTRSGGTFIEI
ncbi:MAG TPA: hypothetical protein DCS93_24965 [Microscillaceae bacterium]|nr:hypothetical protein [Microscillaceae bacterium]